MYIDENNIRSLDLNLLVALDALLRERSVTRAARRVGVGQPAMSHSLKRLREFFGDPIFVRVGREMQVTPFAQQLEAPLRRWLAELRTVLNAPGPFDPATCERSFTLITSDLLAVVLPTLAWRMQEEAPHVRLEVRTPDADPVQALQSSGADLALAPPQAHAPGMCQRVVSRITWATFVAPGHAGLEDGELSLERWLQIPHITVNTASSSPSFVASAIASAGLVRRVGLVVPSFLVAPYVVARSEMLFTAPRESIGPIAQLLGLCALQPPLLLPEIPVLELWPERLHADPAHAWFRHVVAEVVAEFGADSQA